MSGLDFLRLLHMPIGMAPRVSFVRQALALLDTLENAFPSQEEEKIAQAKKEAVEIREDLASQGVDTDAFLTYNMQELRVLHRISLPLNARYSALISAVIGIESLVFFQDDVRRRQAGEFIRKRAEGATGEDAVMFDRAEKIIRGGTSEQKMYDILERLAQDAGMSCDTDPRWQTLCDLRRVRNRIVHGAGCLKKENKQAFKAAKRLGFSVLDKVNVDGEKFEMPLGTQIWIERNALNKPVEQALEFIAQACDKHFLPGT